MTTTRAVLLAFVLLSTSASVQSAESTALPGRSGAILNQIMNRISIQTDEWFHDGAYLRSVQGQKMLVAYNPRDLESYHLAAWLLWSSGRPDEAQDVYYAALRANPQSWETPFELGMHWTGRRDYSQAAFWFTHAVLRGGPPECWKMLAHTYRRLGYLETALGIFQYLVPMAPDDPAVPLNIERLQRMIAERDNPTGEGETPRE